MPAIIEDLVLRPWSGHELQDQDLLVRIFVERSRKNGVGMRSSPACQVFRAAYEAGILDDPNNTTFHQQLPNQISDHIGEGEIERENIARLIGHTSTFMAMLAQITGMYSILADLLDFGKQVLPSATSCLCQCFEVCRYSIGE